MVIKKRVINNKELAIENLANELADKPYGSRLEQESLVRCSISLPAFTLNKLEDIAIANKRSKSNLKSISAIIRYCVDKYLDE